MWRILFFKFFFNCHFRRFWMRVIGKQNSFNFIELASEPQIHWILLGKEFPWDSYFDVLSIQSISGRQKSILSLSLFRSLSLQTQKASQKVVSAESMKQLFFSFSLFPWDPKTCQYHPRKPHGRVRTFFFLSLWCTESPANHVFSPSFFSNLLNICSCQKWALSQNPVARNPFYSKSSRSKSILSQNPVAKNPVGIKIPSNKIPSFSKSRRKKSSRSQNPVGKNPVILKIPSKKIPSISKSRRSKSIH